MPVAVAPLTWRGLPALRLIGSELEAVITLVGGHLASLRFRGEEIDPFWRPHWAGADPNRLDAGQTRRLGGDPAAPLLATIAGSTLCCDRFGPPRPGEAKPVHGEVCRTVFERVDDAEGGLALLGRLPLAGLTIRRRLRLEGCRCHLDTRVSHTGAVPRPVEWCEHSDLGGDFLDSAVFTAPLDRVLQTSHRDAGERFGAGPAGGAVDPTAALRFPRPGEPPCGDVLCGRIADGPAEAAWTAGNPRLGRRLTCRFQRSDWPWLVLWTQHRSRRESPWEGRERVRGMELSTKPMPEGEIPPERRHIWLGRPTTCVIPPGSGLEKRLVFAWERHPGG